MSTDTSASFADFFPPLSEMAFDKDCEIYGNWLAAYVQPDKYNKTIPNGASLVLTLTYVESALPDSFWARDDVAEMTINNYPEFISRVSAWFTYNSFGTYSPEYQGYIADDAFNAATIVQPREKCPAEYCKAMGYTGNQDLSGIGVMTAYYIEAILASFFLTAFTVRQTKVYLARKAAQKAAAKGQLPPSRNKKTWPVIVSNRILEAFRGSLDGFLSNAMLLAVAMLIAAIYTATEKIALNHTNDTEKEIVEGSAIYDIILAVLAASFSVFPVCIIYALMRHPESGQEGSRRKWVRRLMLFVVWALASTVVYLGPRGDVDYEFRKSDPNLILCDQRGGLAYWHGLKAAQFMVIGLPVLWLVITTFVLTGFGIPGLVARTWVRRWREGWRLTIAWINLLAMWGILAFLTILRGKIKQTAGGLDESSKWSFGQIVAVATWVPVIAEFFYILCFGIVDGLTGHLPHGFKITAWGPPDLEFYYPDANTTPGGGDGGAGGGLGDSKIPLMGITTTSGIDATPMTSPYSAPPSANNLAYNPPAAPPSSSSYFLPINMPTTENANAAPAPAATAAAHPMHAATFPMMQMQTAYDPGAFAPQQLQPQLQQVPIPSPPEPAQQLPRQQGGYVQLQDQEQGQPQQHHHHIHMPTVFHHQDPQRQQQHAFHEQQRHQAYNQWHQTGW